jgi:hypothetical protein
MRGYLRVNEATDLICTVVHVNFGMYRYVAVFTYVSFMQGIYAYIPETNRVPKEYNVEAILSLLFMVPISLAPALVLMYFYISTFRSMCAVPNMAVLFSSLTSWFPDMVLKYFLNDFKWFQSLQLLLVSP